jgi:hypothetical protein
MSLKCARVFALVVFLAFLPACSLVKSLVGADKTTELSLNTAPTSIAVGTQLVFSAIISHNNGNFEGATGL